MDGEPTSKKIKQSAKACNYEIIGAFTSWLEKEKFDLSSKLEIQDLNSCPRFGVIAKDNIDSGDVIISIPRNSILWERNCTLSSSLLDCNLCDGSGWVKLILSLMHEFTNINSKWQPYMRFLPSVEHLDQPMFWNSQLLNLLKGTGVDRAVMEDLKKIQKEYTEVALPFIKNHSDLGFDAEVHTLDLYKHMVAFIMAYSFTEELDDDDNDEYISPPVMVPLADAFNHVSNNNACLEFEPDRLLMRATRDIKAGQEVYNTYGQLSNAQLLQMYGFVESFPSNIYDTVDIELSLLLDSAPTNFPCLDKKIKWLEESRDIPRDFLVVININGILTVNEFKLINKVLLMSEEEFTSSALDEEDGWESDSDDDEDEDEFEVLSFKKIKQLTSDIKSCFHSFAQSRVNSFNQSLLDLDAIKSDELSQWRASRCRALIQGQQKIFEILIDATME